MISIFYDLETTDLEPVGQILNYAFIAVDNNFRQVGSIADKVRISRLQLPKVGAILSNRINVLKQQKTTTQTEYEAVQKINAFIKEIIAKARGEAVSLIGYNSTSFDLDFLRTTFIRNGVSPYFNGVLNKDLLLVTRYLMAFNDDFREKVFTDAGKEKVKLSLEKLTKLFGLLYGAQDHESLSDVLLTIELTKYYIKKFNIDVRTFEPYQVKSLHSNGRGKEFVLAEPISKEYHPDKRCKIYSATLLDANDKYALWIDLKKYEELKKEKVRDAIRWRKFFQHIVIEHTEPPETSYKSLIPEALTDLKDINLTNYFTETTCDIEQFIYRMPPQEIRLLDQAIRLEQMPLNTSKDMQQLYKRFTLENFTKTSPELLSSLAKYAEYRYGGQLVLEDERQAGGKAKKHATLKKLFAEIEEARATADKDDLELIDALKTFYRESEIYKVAGDKLMALPE